MEEKIDKLDNHMEAIKYLLTKLNDSLEETNTKIETIERKIDNFSEKIDGEVLEECKKMGEHIDFVEEVYDNVKHPLGYLCKKIKYLTGSNDTRYTLTDLQKEEDKIEPM